MNHAGYEYEVKPVLELTRDEVKLLVGMANGHYDAKCRSFAEKGGLLRKFGHLFENDFDNGTSRIKMPVTLREIDTLCKIVEQDTCDPSRWDGLREVLTAGSAEQARLNKEL